LSAARDSSDGSSEPEKFVRELFPLTDEPDFDDEPEPLYTEEAPSSSASSPPAQPPSFSSLFPPSTLLRSTPTRHSKALGTEPEPSSPPPAFTQLQLVEPPPEAVSAPSPAEAEVKAALPHDTKGESSGKAAEESEPPPPYTEGDSPIEGLQYVMAAAGGASSIITQVQQGGPAPLTGLGGMFVRIVLSLN
jgi:hypothetical protein